MKRILFFDGSLDGKVGGSHHSLLLLVKHLDSSRYRKIVVLNSDNALRAELGKHCESVITWNGPSAAYFAGLAQKNGWDTRFSSWPGPADRILNWFHKNARAVFNDIALGALVTVRYLRLLKQEEIDILHLNNWFDPYWTVAAKLARVPVIQHIRGIVPSTYAPFCHWTAKVICISEDIKKRLIQDKINPDKVVRIYNALDPEEFRPEKDPEAVRSELGLKGSEPVVAMFGNIQRWKGQETVIKACQRLRQQYPSLACVLFGETIEHDYARELRELAISRGMNGHVKFAGYRNDVADCMNASDIIVHASIQPEPFGRVIIEAMCLGKPVIAADDGAVPEIVEDGISGLLYEPGNDKQLGKQIDFLLSHPTDAARMGQNAASRAREHFDIRQQIDRIMDIYEEVLNRAMAES